MLKKLVKHILPSTVSGLIFGMLSINIFFAIFLSFCVQYFFMNKNVDGEETADAANNLGILLGLSTMLYGPVISISYWIGWALLK